MNTGGEYFRKESEVFSSEETFVPTHPLNNISPAIGHLSRKLMLGKGQILASAKESILPEKSIPPRGEHPSQRFLSSHTLSDQLRERVVP